MGDILSTLITTIVNVTVVPVTAPIPFLATSGILLAIFGAVWAVFAFALVRNRAGLDAAWFRLRRWNLVLQGIAWLLFLPIVFGLWTWRRSWPLAWRVVVIAAVAGWNLLVFIPQPA